MTKKRTSDEDPGTALERGSCYTAVRSRDARFDGRFFTAVRTTGIYCRPVCPAPAPKLENVEFYRCAAAAEEAGFRPCRRCRPETSPGTPAWLGTSATVSRALALIAEGALDGGRGADALAGRLGVGERHLRRLFLEHLGTTPGAVARTRRAHFARRLIDETDVPMTVVALSAGYSSVRRFNEAIRETFDRTPSELRKGKARGSAGGRARGGHRPRRDQTANGALTLRLPYRPPFEWEELLAFFGPRATPGVESVRDGCYRRTITVEGRGAALEVRCSPDEPCLLLSIPGPTTELPAIVARVRRIFDLGADPMAIAADLGRDRAIGKLVRRRPGLRLPGSYDRFESAVRAIIGQQVSVKGATTLAGRLAERFGTKVETPFDGLCRIFPGPARLVDAPVESIGMPAKRGETIRELARRILRGSIDLDGRAEPDDLAAELMRIPGIGEWTAQYIAMRAVPSPDAFPAGDLGIRKALADADGPITGRRAREIARPWKPWRAYAVMHLWRNL